MRGWESAEFDRLAHGRARSVVVMGAGGLGRRCAAALRADGIEPLAFADNSAARQGTMVDGIRVLSPNAAVREFGTRAAFVVAIWGANSPHRFAHSRQQLTQLGCDRVVSFASLAWKYPGALLPHYLQDLPHNVISQQSAVRAAFGVWEDDASRAEYVAQVRFRLLADFDGLPHPVKHPAYFPPDSFAPSSPCCAVPDTCRWWPADRADHRCPNPPGVPTTSSRTRPSRPESPLRESDRFRC